MADVRLLSASRAEAFRQGVVGYAQDVFIQGQSWPFDPRSVVAPVAVVHGECGTVLSLDHSRHTTVAVPGSTMHILPRHGHFTILAALPDTVDDMRPVAR